MLQHHQDLQGQDLVTAIAIATVTADVVTKLAIKQHGVDKEKIGHNL